MLYSVYELLNDPPPLLSYRATLLPNPTLFAPSFLLPTPRFHFYIAAERTGSLRVLMQQAEGDEAILWSRSHNTVSHWTSEYLPVGRHQQPYTVLTRASTTFVFKLFFFF